MSIIVSFCSVSVSQLRHFVVDTVTPSKSSEKKSESSFGIFFSDAPTPPFCFDVSSAEDLLSASWSVPGESGFLDELFVVGSMTMSGTLVVDKEEVDESGIVFRSPVGGSEEEDEPGSKVFSSFRFDFRLRLKMDLKGAVEDREVELLLLLLLWLLFVAIIWAVDRLEGSRGVSWQAMWATLSEKGGKEKGGG